MSWVDDTVGKLDFWLHVGVGAVLGFWLAPESIAGKIGLPIVIYLAGEAREVLQQIASFEIQAAPQQDTGLGPGWRLFGAGLGEKRRWEALAWLLGAVTGVLCAWLA